MQPTTLLLTGLAGAFAVYTLARRRVVAMTPRRSSLRSLPGYYGAYASLWMIVPLCVVLLLWLALSGRVVDARMAQLLPADVLRDAAGNVGLALNEIGNIADGVAVSDDPVLVDLAADYRALRGCWRGLRWPSPRPAPRSASRGSARRSRPASASSASTACCC